jgi:hypothetical protein
VCTNRRLNPRKATIHTDEHRRHRCAHKDLERSPRGSLQRKGLSSGPQDIFSHRGPTSWTLGLPEDGRKRRREEMAGTSQFSKSKLRS